MPESIIHTWAADLVEILCQCISELEISECLCFAGNNDLCCDPIIGWFGVYPECSGVFVNFIGTTEEDVTIGNSPCGPRIQFAHYNVGVMLCEPQLAERASSADLEKFALYAECLMHISEEVHQCLGGLTCCDGLNPTIRVSAIDAMLNGFQIGVSVQI